MAFAVEAINLKFLKYEVTEVLTVYTIISDC